MPGPTSDYIVSTQDGNGRIQHKWNASSGTGETYMVSSEPAWFWDVSITGNPYMEFKFASEGTADNPISWDTHMAFNTNGNIGIGTTSPNAKLDIKDHTDTGIMLYLTDDNNSSGELAHKAIQIQTQGTKQSWVATNGDVFYNGSMGIGTESTLSDLDIEQSGGSASNQGTGGINLRKGTYHWRMYNSSNFVRFNYSSDDGVTYTPKAYISPTDGSWNQLSDISLKHNIEELNPVINQIKQINVIQYNYIDNPDGCSKVLARIIHTISFV